MTEFELLFELLFKDQLVDQSILKICSTALVLVQTTAICSSYSQSFH